MMGVIVIIILALLMTLLLKMIKKYTHNMALMSRHIIRDSYLVEDVPKKLGKGQPPPPKKKKKKKFFLEKIS